MKKFVLLLTTFSLLFSSGAYAEQKGRGSMQGAESAANNQFQWVIGIGAIGVIATMAAVIATNASHHTHSHS